MQEPQELQLSVVASSGSKETNSMENHPCQDNNQSSYAKINHKKRYYHWFRVSLYAAFVLLSQSIGTLLGRLYYEKGGHSKWLATIVQIAGFPVLLPYYFITSPPKNIINDEIPNNNNNNNDNQPSTSMQLAFVYISLGLLVALDCYLYSIGLCYLPVSTLALICSSQLGFNALFSYFLNSLKFTPYIVNSLVLLTISSVLLVFQPGDDDSSDPTTKISKKKYIIGFICTVAASAGYGLSLSLQQLALKKVLKGKTFKVVMDLIIYQCLVATIATLVGLFASGEWSDLTDEMENYEMGKVSYVLNLSFTAIIWQLFSIGCVGLIFEVSSLFSNSISVLGVPLVPILAVVFFKDKMHGIKAISMVLAVWGFISYVYQQYEDERKSNNSENRNNGNVSKAASS